MTVTVLYLCFVMYYVRTRIVVSLALAFYRQYHFFAALSGWFSLNIKDNSLGHPVGLGVSRVGQIWLGNNVLDFFIKEPSLGQHSLSLSSCFPRAFFLLYKDFLLIILTLTLND